MATTLARDAPETVDVPQDQPVDPATVVPTEERSTFPSWLKYVMWGILILVVVIVLATLLFSSGCKPKSKSLLCSIADLGSGIGKVIREAASHIWALVVVGVAGILAFLGFKIKGYGPSPTPTPTPDPEPKPEPTPEPGPDPEPDPEPGPEPVVDPVGE
jgi:hypothetical protein